MYLWELHIVIPFFLNKILNNFFKKYGDKHIERLSIELTKEYGSGFSVVSLRRMRVFFETFPIWSSVMTELSWTHYQLILRLDSAKTRDYYINEAVSR